MIKYVYIKTDRAKRRGEAKGTIHKFMNYTTNKINYSFSFYNTRKYFDTYNELRDYVNNNYIMLGYYFGIERIEYKLPEKEREFFK